MIKILHNLPLFGVKNANFFAEFFRRKYLNNHNIGPGNIFNESQFQRLSSIFGLISIQKQRSFDDYVQ
jgi:hypothetical protein